MIDARSTLTSGAAELGLQLGAAQIEQLEGHLALLHKWNKVYNLTAVRDPQEMLTQHLLDCLAAVPPLVRCTGGRPARILDVGSGGGLPGAVLAICRPELEVDCVDTVGKKAAFICQVAASLRLPNLRGTHARVESLAGPFDVIVSRAFASLPDFVNWTRAARAPLGVWMAMKGKHPQAEIDALPPDVQAFHVEPLSVPGLQAGRCIVWLRPR